LDRFDIVVVGAGVAGCVAARKAAELGSEVCLIDRKPRSKVGDKVCGDAISKSNFDQLKMDYPSGEELACKIKGILVYSPDLGAVYNIKGEGFIVNRLAFGQGLMNRALNAGVLLYDNAAAVEPIIKENSVKGVRVKDLVKGKIVEVYGKVTIDASGFHSVLRGKMPPEWHIESNIAGEDVVLCYREIRELKDELKDPNYCKIYLNQTVALGGYIWVFPKSKTRVNIGLGVQKKVGFVNPKTQFCRHILSQPTYADSTLIHGGGGEVPTRKPIDPLVVNGLIFAGDAACQANPLHGGGIGPAMAAGLLAAETAVKALEIGDFSQKSLWSYNLKFMNSIGAKHVGLDVFRIFLQRTRDEDLNYGMQRLMITESDLLKVSAGEDLRLNVSEKVGRAIRGSRKIRLLIRLKNTATIMRKLRAIYQEYPLIPEKHTEWKKLESSIYERALTV
jgi:geranylgeranyl reductase family protein